MARAVHGETNRYSDGELAFVLDFMKRTAALMREETKKPRGRRPPRGARELSI